jgi:glycosyltransferase involved in cell wall biosynthesis
MKILFGIPSKVHKEIALAEVLAFKELGAIVETSDYGNSGEEKGLFKSFLIVLRNAINLKKKLIKHKSEIIYLNTAFDNKTLVRDSITIFILRIFNKTTKIVLKVHGSVAVVVSANNIFKRYLFNKISLFLLLSTEERSNFINAGMDSSRIFITANVVDKSSFQPDPSFEKKFSITRGTIILLFVGRFIEEKGILDLIKACELLKEKSIQFKLFCLGDGPLFSQAKTLINKSNLTDNVKLLGHIPERDTKLFYSNCHILVLPTFHDEGFPMAIFQAVASGMSIITTKIRGSADYLEEYNNCLWVKKNSPEDIYDKVLILKNNDFLREKIKLNNRRLADKFNAQSIVADLHTNFQKLFKFINF